jgi:HAD superfamily hydrolase (TIGR01549 family)
MIKAVLFDVDGVLIDTFEGNRRTFNHVLEKLGRMPISENEYRRFYYRPAKDIFAYRFPEKTPGEIEKIMGEFFHIVQRFFRYDKLYPDARETLKVLRKDFRLGVVTNRRTPDILDFFRIKDYFGAIICLPDVRNHKPHPEPINLALKRLKIKPEEAVYVGDAASDAEASKAAGVKVIIYRNPEVRGDYNIMDFGEIPKIVEKLNKA